MWVSWIIWFRGGPWVWTTNHKPPTKRCIGPYWTRDEAKHMLHKWTK